MAIVVSPAAEVTVLSVGWPVYSALLAETVDHGQSRVAYDGAVLEIVSPSQKHEVYNRLLEALVRETARAWGIELLGCGSATLMLAPRGAEPDSSFSLGSNATLMRNRDTIDLRCDPAPDIAVEIDITRVRIDKRAIYASFGVAEFWRYDGAALRAYDLRDPAFGEIECSGKLGGVPIAQLDAFLEMRGDLSHAALTDLWRQWLLEHRPL